MVYGITSIVHLFSSYFHGNSNSPMDPAEFRVRGKQMVDYIADYLEGISKRRVVPSVEPGYLKNCLPDSAPMQPQKFEDIMSDIEKYIMPGVTHWQHPRFHAYFPAGNSFPSILADMLSDAIGCVGFSWAASPACTELETIMLDWLGKMINLPEAFLPFTPNGVGGGVIQGSASECILVSLLAARFETVKALRSRYPFVEEGILISKLIAYCSKESHSSVEKACMIGFVKLKILETDGKFRLRGDTLRNAIADDRNTGLVPFFVSTTLGTTSCCSFDVLSEIGPVCTEESLWLHVDAAYAGSAFMCPEFQYLMRGVEHATSFNMNPNKWMLVNFDCSTMWVKDRFKLTQALVVDPLYLQHSYMDKAIDYRHWGIPLSRRFRSLKLWFVIRMYGVEGLRSYIREHVRLAKRFETLVRSDDRFEVVGEVILGLVCFRLKATNELNKKLLTSLNASGRLHMVPASLNDTFVIRFCVCAERATDRDILIAWEIIRSRAAQLFVWRPKPLNLVEAIAAAREKRAMRNLMHGASAGMIVACTDGICPLSSAADTERTRNHSDPVADEEEELLPLEEEQDRVSTIGTADDRKNHSLAYKRSFFVRMVSDPKCYNPKIVRTLTASRRRLSEDLHRDMSLRCDLTQQASVDTGVQMPL